MSHDPRRFAETPVARWLGIEILEPDGGDCRIALPAGEHQRNQRGAVHGGVVASLLDCALGGAVLATMRPEEWCATLHLDVHFVRPAFAARLIGVGRVVGRGERVAFAEGEVVDEAGEVLSKARGVWHIWPGHPDR